MGIEETLKAIPREGFLKVASQKRTDISASDRSVLIRRGNEMFNAGMFDQAKKVFLTTGYSDGIIRLGDHYYNQSDHMEALRMYWLAPAPEKVEQMIERMTSIIQGWMGEDERTDDHEG